MKIKTITCHDVYNVGASLQAYALAQYLTQLGHDVEIINYKPSYLVHHKLIGVSNSKYDKPLLRELYNIVKFPERLKSRCSRRKRQYDLFTRNYLPVTSCVYESNQALKENPPKADVYFTGSDQIWNTLFDNGKDPAFYLDFVPKGAVRASYAASFSTEDVAEEWKQQVKEWLSALDYISVRESSGVDIINHLGIDGSVQVLDPVFLLSADQWENIEEKLDITEPYLLLYDFDRDPKMGEFAKRISKKNGWKIYSILSNDDCNRCFDQEGPLTFLWLIHHAQFVISNSFHATAFSIIYQKQFVVFDRKENINTRMRDLISLMGVENCLMTHMNCAETVVLNYTEINVRLIGAIQKSKSYINRVLKGVDKGDR